MLLLCVLCACSKVGVRTQPAVSSIRFQFCYTRQSLWGSGRSTAGQERGRGLLLLGGTFQTEPLCRLIYAVCNPIASGKLSIIPRARRRNVLPLGVDLREGAAVCAIKIRGMHLQAQRAAAPVTSVNISTCLLLHTSSI